MEPSTKLFPAVFAKATSPNVFQFELGRIKVEKGGVEHTNTKVPHLFEVAVLAASSRVHSWRRPAINMIINSVLSNIFQPANENIQKATVI